VKHGKKKLEITDVDGVVYV